MGVATYLVPYTIIPSRTGKDHAAGGILQVIDDVKSRDQVGKEGFKTLLQLFEARYGIRGSPGFRAAQLEFCRSMAGYAVVCYLLQIKDRHNGNILLDKVGHIVHIDFGFLLGISPGGNLGFENAAFKFSHEMMELLLVEGGAGAGPQTPTPTPTQAQTPEGQGKRQNSSSAYQYFVTLTLRAFLAARAIMDPILVGSFTALCYRLWWL